MLYIFDIFRHSEESTIDILLMNLA